MVYLIGCTLYVNLPHDTLPRDTLPRDTLPRDTLPRQSIFVMLIGLNADSGLNASISYAGIQSDDQPAHRPWTLRGRRRLAALSIVKQPAYRLWTSRGRRRLAALRTPSLEWHGEPVKHPTDIPPIPHPRSTWSFLPPPSPLLTAAPSSGALATPPPSEDPSSLELKTPLKSSPAPKLCHRRHLQDIAQPLHTTPHCARTAGGRLEDVTGQSPQPQGSYKPAKIKEVHSKLHSFQASLCTSHSYTFNPDICLHIYSVECTVRLLNQAGLNNYPYNPKFVGNTGNRTRDLWLDKCISN